MPIAMNLGNPHSNIDIFDGDIRWSQIVFSGITKSVSDALKSGVVENTIAVGMNDQHTAYISLDCDAELYTDGINGCTIISIALKQTDGTEQRFLGHYDAFKLQLKNGNIGSIIVKLRDLKKSADAKGGGSYAVEYAIYTPKSSNNAFWGYEFCSEVMFLESRIKEIFSSPQGSIIPYESGIGKDAVEATSINHFFKITKFNGKTYFFGSNGFKKELFT